MTVEIQTKKVGPLPGNGSTRTFSFSPFVIFETTDIVVTQVVDATGVETTLSLGTGANAYSVTASTTFPGTGSIDYPEAGGTLLPSGESIVIKRLLTIEQLTDLENQGVYFADTLEEQLDKLVMIDLQQQEEIDRSFKLPVSSTGTDPEIEDLSGNAGKFLRVDTAEDKASWAAVAATTGSASDVAPQDVSLTAAASGGNSPYARDDHIHLLPVVSVAKGGTASTDAGAARTALSAQEDVITTKGDLPQGDTAGGDAERLAIGTTGQVLTVASGKASWAASGLPRSYLSGLQMTNDSDTDHDISIAVGECRANTGSSVEDDMALSSALVKRIDNSWSVGTGNGGLDGTESSAGTPDASTWYHVYVIKRSDTSVVDAIYSESASAPTLPSNYDAYRRIGSVLTNGSANIIAFFQAGDEVLWDAPPLDVNVSNQGTSSISYALSAPLGVKTIAKFMARTNTNDGVIYLRSLDQSDEAVASQAAGSVPMGTKPLTLAFVAGGGETPGPAAQMQIRTNTSSQIAARGDQASITLDIIMLGYIDSRGRND